MPLTKEPIAPVTKAALPQRNVVTRFPSGEAVHRLLLALAALAFASLVAFLALRGFSYYSLSLEERPLSPLHSQLRSSGSIGLRLAFLGVAMFGALFLYPLRKRWRWLASKGSTRRWLNFHILFGIATPTVVTFHSAFRWHGVAGLAYWTMIAVALSGFVGRYVYAKIPRSINSVTLSMEELEAQAADLAARLSAQNFFRPGDLAPLLDVPPAAEVRAMGFAQLLFEMLRIDLARPFLVGRLRRRVLTRGQWIGTVGGLLASHDRDLESIVANARRQSRLRAAMAFLHRTERIFQLWHVIHRPFSISFVALILVHIGVALWVGF